MPCVSYVQQIAKVLQQVAEQWKTTIGEEGHTEAVKIMRFICGKSIVVFHCPLGMLQDFAICCKCMGSCRITITTVVLGLSGALIVGSY